MFDTFTLLSVVATFLLAGTVKGVIGLGLPTISLAIMAVVMDITGAMALLLVPSALTNVWQAAVGGHATAILKRLWPFLLIAGATVWLGAEALSRVDLPLLSALLGLLLIVYAVSSLAGFRLHIDGRRETWLGPVMGAINGVLTGMTGSFVVPGVLYLQALSLPRDMLIQAMGMFFTISTLALAAALHGGGFLNAELGILSAIGLPPALIGMVFGQRIRKRLSEDLFRRVFFASLLLLGAYILIRNVQVLVA